MSAAFSFLVDHWLVMSFLALAFWALVNIIDVYFVEGIYKDAADGAIISGLLQAVPWLFLFPFVGIGFSDLASPGVVGTVFGLNAALWLSLAGGIAYTVGIYYYFSALFDQNDAPFLQILGNLRVVAVPLLAFLLFGESLSVVRYVGMGIVFLGATMLSISPDLRKKFSMRYAWIMVGAVLFLCFSMVLSGRAYDLLGAQYGSQAFWFGFLFFSLGAALGGLLLSLCIRRNPFPTIGRYWNVILLGEGLYFLGHLSSQRAIDLAPSAAYVAVIETFDPVFIMAYSMMIVGLAPFVLRGRSEIVGRIYSEQINGIRAKLLATVVMAIGVYIISS